LIKEEKGVSLAEPAEVAEKGGISGQASGDVGSKTTWGLEARDAILPYEEARAEG